MTEQRKPGPNFEQRLLDQLKAIVADRAAGAARLEAENATTAKPAWRRRGPRLALGAAVALAGVTAALIVSAGGDNPSKAFAVEPQDGGGVTIEVYSLEDAAGLEGALANAGIPSQVTWLPAGKACREPRYTPSSVKTPLGGAISGMGGGGPRDHGDGSPGALTIAVMSTDEYREYRRRYVRGELSEDEIRRTAANITLDPEEFRPGQSVVISGSPGPYEGDPEGGYGFKFGIAAGPVEPCEPVPALPDGGEPFGIAGAGAGIDYAPIGDKALRQSTIAADLRQAATAAEASETQVEAPPAPGQFLYVKTKVVHLQGWLPEGSETRPAGTKEHPRYFTDRSVGEPDVRSALVPTLKEVWTAPDGKTRVRETLGRVDFLSDADQRLWEEAGSPPPFAYDPDEHDVGHDDSGRPVKDFASKAFRGRREFSYVDKLALLPTEPEALRLVVENRRGASSPADPSPADSSRGGATVETLLEILSEPIATRALRAAAFNALAEIPRIGLQRGVADAAGRKGDAIGWVTERGFGRRYIFDPDTGKILASAEMIFGGKYAEENGVSPGTVFRETAYLESGIVGSAHERPK